MSMHFPFYDPFNNKSLEQGFLHWNLVPLSKPLHLSFYEAWLERGFHGDMEYLEKHLPEKRDPSRISGSLQSSFVFIHPYFPHPFGDKSNSGSKRVALYAQGKDYHHWMLEKLDCLVSFLKEKFPEEIFLPSTDSSPVLERDLAYRAGLGWIGKNTCLIRPQVGSLFFIAEILSSLKTSTTPELMHDFCGRCNRCIEACPTGAIEEPRLLNANKCISYLTIESKKVPPKELRHQIGDWFFGCDICQTVCPWNQKVFGSQLETAPRLSLEKNQSELVAELREILSLSGKQLTKKFKDSPLSRARPFGLRRNAIVVAANQNLQELAPEISSYLEDIKLGELAAWALEKLQKSP